MCGEVWMRRKLRTLAVLAAAGALLAIGVPRAFAQVEGGGWTAYSPGFKVQQKGCGQVSNLTFKLTCSSKSGEQLRVYINGSLKYTQSTPSGSYYDKFGAYRTASGQGPITVEWSNIQFWRK